MEINDGKFVKLSSNILLKNHWKLMILEKYHLEYIVILTWKD